MKRKAKAKKENSERWLLTYSDMITLLLALFILLYGMSQVDQNKYQALAESLNQSLGDGKGISVFDSGAGVLDKNGNSMLEHNNGANGADKTQGTTTATPVPTPGGTTEDKADKTETKKSLTTQQEMNDLKNGVDKALTDMKMNDAISTTLTEKGLTITFKDDEFFDSGKAELKSGMKNSLTALANLLNRISNDVDIDGYTDNVPINSWIYPSNWQLSGARAASVAQYLQEHEGLDGNRLSATGHGENNPVASNDTKDGRSKNRRILVTILYNDASGMKFKQ